MPGVRFRARSRHQQQVFLAKAFGIVGVVSCPADDHHGFIRNRRASANEEFMRI
jgi:hypothetical protein